MNWACPLNLGLLAWYLTSPTTALSGWGSNTWLDLVRDSSRGPFDATLTTMNNASNGWQPSAHPGGFGSILLDGTAGFMGNSTYAPLDSLAAASISLWYKATVTGHNTGTIGWQNDTFGDALFAFDTGSAAVGVYCLTTSTGASALYSNAAATDGNWHHLVGTYNGANLILYFDGLQRTSTALTASLNTSLGGMLLGKTDEGTARFFAGSIDDFRVWNRALSAEEVTGLFKDSIQGYPSTLNWSNSLQNYSSPSAAVVVIDGAAPSNPFHPGFGPGAAIRVRPTGQGVSNPFIFRRTLSGHGTRTGSRQTHN